MLIVYLYVNDLIYMGNNTTMFGSFKKSMMAEFQPCLLICMFPLYVLMNIHFGMMHYFLGIEVIQSSTRIIIS